MLSNKYVLAEEVTSLEVAKKLYNKTIPIIVDNPKSILLFREVDKEYLWEFTKTVVSGKEPSYFLVSYVNEEGEYVGVSLFSKGNPWYNLKKTVISEELTVSFKRGFGITRAVSKYLESCLGDTADIIMASSANTYCAKLIENTYSKFGYTSFKNYYKSV